MLIYLYLHQPVNVLTHSNSWKSHSFIDMSAEHEAEIKIQIMTVSFEEKYLAGVYVCLTRLKHNQGGKVHRVYVIG